MDIGDVPKERMEDRKGGERSSERMWGRAAQKGVDDSSACLKCISQ